MDLPKFAVGGQVKLCFGQSGVLTNGRIVKIHFDHEKVKYDVQLACLTIIKDIDSAFVSHKNMETLYGVAKEHHCAEGKYSFESMKNGLHKTS